MFAVTKCRSSPKAGIKFIYFFFGIRFMVLVSLDFLFKTVTMYNCNVAKL